MRRKPVAKTIDRVRGSGSGGWLDDRFHVSNRGSTVSTEVRAGITTFLAMAYIIFVNPSILSNAIDFEGAFPQLLTVTCVAAAVGTLIMGLWANLPFALAPGMGLNAYFTFTVVLGSGYEWETALGAVFVSGILFLVISVTGLRTWILDAIPLYLKHAVTAGIGAFLAIIGFQGSGLIGDSPATLVTRGDWTSPTLWLAAGG
ncbi:MAG: NCS2 family permease, partial [Acidimicrobiia bacterium]|nr:NCS2 family permease [Acidimicrobiia bacterium]NNC92911.1 NCS2 family permease [Acidimicrobiia bacterium]